MLPASEALSALAVALADAGAASGVDGGAGAGVAGSETFSLPSPHAMTGLLPPGQRALAPKPRTLPPDLLPVEWDLPDESG